jgi:predicted nucleic acid-binding protein
MLRRNSALFQAEQSSRASPDTGDTKFIECALTARADFIIRGNKRHFLDKSYGSAHVFNAGELLDRITLEL